MKNTILSQTAKAVAISALALNLGATSACSLFTNPDASSAGGGGKAVINLLAAAVPIAAIVAIADDDDAPTTTTMNMPSPMPGTTPGLPTTTISSPTDNNDGTITWTVNFSRSVSGITTNDFSLTGGGTVTRVSPMSGTTVMVTTTHMSNGMVTLTYMGTGAMDRTSDEFTFTAPAPLVNYLADFPTTSITLTSSSATERNVQRTGTMVDIAGTTYEFASETSRDGYLLSTNENLAIYRNGDDFGFATFISGTNVAGTGTATTDITHVEMAPFGIGINDNTPSANSPTAMVSFTGDYLVARVPTNDDNITDDGVISTGDFTMDVNFTGATAGGTLLDVFTGTTMNEDGQATGTFSNGRVILSPTGGGITLEALRFTGSGDLAGVSITNLAGDFLGSDDTDNIFALGRTGLIGEAGDAVMGIIGTKQ